MTGCMDSPGARLQRGRAPESAEWSVTRSRPKSKRSLQRGRAPESAECLATKKAQDAIDKASTGPRSGERGVRSASADSTASVVLQRGRAPESAEWASMKWRPASCRSFNGAALRRARSVGKKGGASGVGKLQRGRAPESAEWATNRVDRLRAEMLQRGRAPESAE